MAECFYFQVTLEPHLKHSGAKTGRKIYFLVEVPRALARAAAEGESDDELALRQSAQRLAGELAPVAMRGTPCSPGEDAMAVSCQFSHPGLDALERVPDAVLNGARAWLLGTDPD
ncbi:MAG: hypothetical protein JO015_21785 [Verrucomicrobia bacterium]|nr:hypothetical protein [Verrucomicrobiota bacterium]